MLLHLGQLLHLGLQQTPGRTWQGLVIIQKRWGGGWG